ncbi:ATP-binding protein [Streptomyces sp. NPDC047071]|uniref:ATP-binding protein n=1 Tax=Streptomyces sp. NPDC047071 TaxID=3154808 RepID=UPI0034525B33
MLNRPRDESNTDEPDHAAGATAQRAMVFARRKLSARTAREFIDETLIQWGCGDCLDDVRLCTSELDTNALLHGTSTDDVVLVRVEIHDAQLLVEVHDGGDGTPRQHQARDISDNGRGLFLVAAPSPMTGASQPVKGPANASGHPSRSRR